MFSNPISAAFLCLFSFVFCLMAEATDEKTAERSSYVLKPNDVVALSVFNEASLSSQTRILQTGEAMFPLVGSVKIAGLTISAAMEKLRALYDADYLVDPKLTLSVDEYAVQQVLVLGAVRAAGQIPIPPSGKLDMAAAIAAAGGLSETADADQISLERADGGSGVYTLAGIERGKKVQLSPGDRVIVKESRFVNQSVTFVGEVRSRGSVAFPMDGQLDIVTAIARAGGFTELANPRKTSINRKGRVIVVDVREMASKGGALFKLEPDDIITVPERLF
jgi:polysaccharide biosynthesis/export protein